MIQIDKTGIKCDGERAWTWMFQTVQLLYAVRESRGRDVPAKSSPRASARTVVRDEWTAYLDFSSNLQRCWAHILPEAEHAAEKQLKDEPIHQSLRQAYPAL